MSASSLARVTSNKSPMHHIVSERGTDKARQRSDLGSTKIQSCLDGATISVVGGEGSASDRFFFCPNTNPLVLGIHNLIGDLAIYTECKKLL